MIKDLAAAYHAECLASCQELLELQKKWDEVSNKMKDFDEVFFTRASYWFHIVLSVPLLRSS